MNITNQIPEHFPGKEFSRQWGREYIYEIDWIRVGTTTSDSQLVVPAIEYRAFAELNTEFWKAPYLDCAAGKIGEGLLNEGQRQAVQIAAGIEKQIKNDDPELNTFASLREVKLDRNGLLYVTTTEEGSRLQGDEPFAAVRNVKALGVVDFATSVRGYYGFFKYDKADLSAFVPDDLLDIANGYAWIDEPRVVVGPNGEHDYQVARMMLLQVETDLDFPLESIDTSLPDIIVEHVEQ